MLYKVKVSDICDTSFLLSIKQSEASTFEACHVPEKLKQICFVVASCLTVNMAFVGNVSDFQLAGCGFEPQ